MIVAIVATAIVDSSRRRIEAVIWLIRVYGAVGRGVRTILDADAFRLTGRITLFRLNTISGSLPSTNLVAHTRLVPVHAHCC